ncbi:MAG: Rhodanese domain protein [candidate division NC10 bacterium]|nr:Rhodanese domain protein [candidate division NC10 bacterium]
MKHRLSQLSTNAKLGALAVCLGVAALFFGDPYDSATATLDTAELAEIVQREVDHVSPEQLADWIIQGRADYRLIDLRTPAEFEQYHIPGAENVAITGLTGHGLLRNEKIVLYSEGGIHSAQAWFLLRAKEYDGVYILRGGLQEWKDSVLFPSLPPDATPSQQVTFAKMAAVSAFFGGQPQGVAAAARPAVAPALPMAKMPATGAPPAAASPKKKKKEGC